MSYEAKGEKSAVITPKERVVYQIHHRETEPLPYCLDFEGDIAERLDLYYGSAHWRSLLDNAIRKVPRPRVGVDPTSGEFYTDWYGSTWRVDCRPRKLIRPVLEKPSLAGYDFPDVDARLDAAWKNEALRAISGQREHFLTLGFNAGLFERTWQLRGFTEALMDAAANPEFYDDLLGRVAEHQLAIIDRLVEMPVDAIMFNDDWGYQKGVLLGPERWRRLLKPRLARQYDRVHRAGKYVVAHCCGNITDIVPDLIEIGLDVLESVQPEAMNPYELKKHYGTRLTFWGGLGSQSTIPFGSVDEIRGEVARLCREMGRGGGYILAPAKELQPGTPVENAAVVVEAFLQQSQVQFP